VWKALPPGPMHFAGDAMYDLIVDIFRVNTFTTCVVLALTGWGALLINIATGSAFLSVGFVPAMGLGALVMIYALSHGGVAVTSFSDANVIIAATLGMMLGFIVMIILIRLVAWATDIKKPVTKADGSSPVT
jgi:hypothetical protein